MKLTEKDIRTIGDLAGDPERLDKQDYKNVTVLALTTEIERLQAENAALRAEVEAARQALIIIGDGAHSLHYAGVPAGGQYALQELNRTAKDMLNRLNVFNAALDTKSDAAPVAPAREIAVGDSVRVTMGFHQGRTGRVDFITNPPDYCKVVLDDTGARAGIPIEQLEKL